MSKVLEENIYDEFRSLYMDKTKRKQYERCSRVCGAKAYARMGKDYTLYSTHGKKRLIEYMNLVAYKDCDYNVKGNHFNNYIPTKHFKPEFLALLESKQQKIYGVIYEGVDGKLNTEFDLGILQSIKGDKTVIKHYVNAVKKGYAKESEEDLALLKSLDGITLTDMAIRAYHRGSYYQGEEAEKHVQYREDYEGYLRTTGTFLTQAHHVSEVHFTPIVVKANIDDCVPIGDREELRRYLSILSRALDYYYDKALTYICYILCKKIGLDDTEYLERRVEDGEYVYYIVEREKFEELLASDKVRKLYNGGEHLGTLRQKKYQRGFESLLEELKFEG